MDLVNGYGFNFVFEKRGGVAGTALLSRACYRWRGAPSCPASTPSLRSLNPQWPGISISPIDYQQQEGHDHDSFLQGFLGRECTQAVAMVSRNGVIQRDNNIIQSLECTHASALILCRNGIFISFPCTEKLHSLPIKSRTPIPTIMTIHIQSSNIAYNPSYKSSKQLHPRRNMPYILLPDTIRIRNPVAPLLRNIPLHLLENPHTSRTRSRMRIRHPLAMLRKFHLVRKHRMLAPRPSPRPRCRVPACLAVAGVVLEVARSGGVLADELGGVAAEEVTEEGEAWADDYEV